MRKRKQLASKVSEFYSDIKSQGQGKMRLQTDLEFQQNQIKLFNEKIMLECIQLK